jgi:hypothetical protein
MHKARLYAVRPENNPSTLLSALLLCLWGCGGYDNLPGSTDARGRDGSGAEIDAVHLPIH